MSHSSSLSQVLVHQAVTPLSKRHIFSETSKTPCEGCGFLIQNQEDAHAEFHGFVEGGLPWIGIDLILQLVLVVRIGT